MSIPLGFRFDPTDEELVSGFLHRKVMGLPLPWNGFLETNLYGASPWDVFRDIDETSLYWHTRKEGETSKGIKKTTYVFTKLTKACSNANSKRISRRAGCGTWNGQTGPKMIKNSQTGQVIGRTRMLNFQHSKTVATSSSDASLFGHWIMHEYCLDGVSLINGDAQCNSDVVLCKITKCLKENDRHNVQQQQQPTLPQLCFSMSSNNGGDSGSHEIPTTCYEVESSKKRCAEDEWNQEDLFDLVMKKQKYSCGDQSYSYGNDDDNDQLFEGLDMVQNWNVNYELFQGV